MEEKELLAEEFKSIGFYLTDHPLNEYDDIFNELNIKAYNEFFEKIMRKRDWSLEL